MMVHKIRFGSTQIGKRKKLDLSLMERKVTTIVFRNHWIHRNMVAKNSLLIMILFGSNVNYSLLILLRMMAVLNSHWPLLKPKVLEVMPLNQTMQKTSIVIILFYLLTSTVNDPKISKESKIYHLIATLSYSLNCSRKTFWTSHNTYSRDPKKSY